MTCCTLTMMKKTIAFILLILTRELFAYSIQKLPGLISHIAGSIQKDLTEVCMY